MERRDALVKILNDGDFAHNYEDLEKQKGKHIQKYRSGKFENSLSFHEKKTIIKTCARPRVEQDDYHQLSREEHVIILSLRSGHNRLNHHLSTKLKLVPSPLCACGAENQTAEHILQRISDVIYTTT